MYWRSLAIVACLAAGNALAAQAYILGVGGEGDSADGLAGTIIADVGLSEKT